MAKRTLLGAASFAHLFGRGIAAETPENEKDDKAKKVQRKGESDEDYAKRCEEDDENASRAEDKDDEGMEDESDDEDDDGDEPQKSKKGKKAKKAEKPDDEGDDDEDDDGNEEAEENGRKAERARWTSVMQHPAAGGGRVATACTFLSTTDLSAKQIVGLLKTTPEHAGANGRSRLSERMNAVRTPNVGSDAAGAGKGPTLSEQIVLAGRKRRGEI